MLYLFRKSKPFMKLVHFKPEMTLQNFLSQVIEPWEIQFCHF